MHFIINRFHIILIYIQIFESYIIKNFILCSIYILYIYIILYIEIFNKIRIFNKMKFIVM